MIAIFFVATGVFAPNFAFAHAGHSGHTTHQQSFNADEFAAIELAVAESEVHQDHLAADPSNPATLDVWNAPDGSNGLDGHCNGDCCHPGSGCCAASCLTVEAPVAPLMQPTGTAIAVSIRWSDGIEPAGLSEPPNGRA